MTVSITPGFICEVRAMKTRQELTAPSLPELDQEFEGFCEDIESKAFAKAVKTLAQQIGRLRAEYARARAALSEEATR